MKKQKHSKLLSTLLAIVMVFASILPTAITAKAETVIPGVTATLYNKGNTLDKVLSGLSRESIVSWLSSHENDNYYINTPYPENADGTYIPGASGSQDNRNPNGDCASAYGDDDYPGVAYMNCTGFVWHALWKATGQSYDYGYANIPGLNGWASFILNNNLEHKAYEASSTQLLLNGIAADSYAEKGDIIWFWDDNAQFRYIDGVAWGLAHNHHVGFYWGDSSNRNLWWDSVGISYFDGNAYLKNFIHPLTPKSDNSKHAVVVKIADKRKLSLKKVSANASITDNNRCYSLEGAVYGVYSDSGCTTEVGRLTTDVNGNTNEVELSSGNYWVKEISAPKGYFLDTTVYPVKLTADYILNVKDVPGNDPVELILSKVDAETLQGKPIGGTRLEGAEYTLKYYDVDMTTDPAAAGKTALWTWVLKTDKNGAIYLDDEHKVSGPGYYKDASGNAVFPLGTATIQETKAPEGYLLNDEIFVVNTRLENNRVLTTNLPNNDTLNSKETAQRGDISLRKIDSETQAKMGGASFELISLNADGDEIETHIITTDANGFYSSENSYAAHSKDTNSGEPRTGTWFGVDAPVDDNKNALPYGTYILREIPGENNQGKEMYEDTFEIYADKVMINLGNIENRPAEEPAIGTTAHDGRGNDVIFADEDIMLVDTVEYAGFGEYKGQEVTFVGTLMDKETGEPLLDADGKEITAQAKKQIFNDSSVVDVVFTFDASALGGKDIVVFERVLDVNGELLADHEDIDDEGQTVHIRDMRTTATDGETENHVGTVTATAVINDVIAYNKLPKEEITFKGTLISKETGEPIKDGEGNDIVSSTVVEITEDSGTVTVTFEFDASSLGGSDVVVFEEAYGADGKLVAEHKDIEDDAQTVHYPKIGTNAKDGQTKNNTGVVSENATLIDTVDYQNLVPGYKYRITGAVMDKETGKEVDGVTASAEFTPEEENGKVEVTFTLNTNELAGHSLVVFEKLFVGKGTPDEASEEEPEYTEVARHEDIEDEAQTVHYPKIGTNAKDGQSKNKTGVASANATIIDTVDYQNLVPGLKYKITGAVMDKATGKEVPGVTASAEFIPTAASGKQDVTFKLNTSALAGHSLVVFEKLFVADDKGTYIEVTRHEDINDAAQTVTYTRPSSSSALRPVKTGDNNRASGMAGIFGMASIAFFALVIVMIRRKKIA